MYIRIEFAILMIKTVFCYLNTTGIQRMKQHHHQSQPLAFTINKIIHIKCIKTRPGEPLPSVLG